jgi:glycosyltransferase involved in cell wall biosynthesis
MNPKVSFIVPCYKFAHFLGECVNSILAQTYEDFEVLIMDDCSPDNTREVAAEFKDPRVIYIRNETNLGNIRNFNKGIELSRGSYTWLISADDRLRSKNVLQRYVDLLDRNPQVGYVFCPAMVLREGKECGVQRDWTAWPGDADRIVSRQEVVRFSAKGTPVCAPTGLVRKECYTRVGGFPLSLPRCADWYLWAVFAMMYDVGYLAEPMVYYRKHDTSMDKILEREQPSLFLEQELQTLWLIKKEAEKAGIHGVSSDFCQSLAKAYALRLAKNQIENSQHGRTWDSATQEIHDNASDEKEAQEILRLIHNFLPDALASGYTQAGHFYYKAGQLEQAVTSFRSALALNPRTVRPRLYLGVSRFEQMCGVRLYPWLKLSRNTLLWFLRLRTRRASSFSH